MHRERNIFICVYNQANIHNQCKKKHTNILLYGSPNCTFVCIVFKMSTFVHTTMNMHMHTLTHCLLHSKNAVIFTMLPCSIPFRCNLCQDTHILNSQIQLPWPVNEVVNHTKVQSAAAPVVEDTVCSSSEVMLHILLAHVCRSVATSFHPVNDLCLPPFGEDVEKRLHLLQVFFNF